MQPSDEQQVEWIAKSIAAYWRAHPNAADAVEGVAWWLPELSMEPLPRVQEALERLVAQGIAGKRQLVDGRVIYSARRGSP